MSTMGSEGVAEVDLLTEQMYSASDPVARGHAQASLEVLTKEETDSRLQYAILQQSNSQYTLVFMAQSLVVWFNATRQWMTLEQKRELIVVHCGSCLKRVVATGAPKHVVSSLLTAYARLTKLTFEKEPFLEAAVDFPLEMLIQGQEGSPETVLSLMLLSAMVQEFSRYDSSKSNTYLSFPAHRHCSSNFKEAALLKIYLAALKQLEGLTPNSPHIAEVLKLLESCLQFDFRSIMMDETDEFPFSQFPSSWKDTLLNKHYLATLWGQHARLPYPHCATLLSGLANVCGLHRTLFDSTDERGEFLEYTLAMLTEATMIQDGRMKIPQYVESLINACLRTLNALGYRELRLLSAFEPWLNALLMLSVEVLSIPFGQEGSFTTSSNILSFWASLSTSKRRSYMEQAPRDIEDNITQVLLSFLRARVRGPEEGAVDPTSVCSGDTDELTNVVLSQATSYSTICLLDPVRCMSDLATYISEGVGPLLLSSPLSTGWLFYLAGSIVRLVFSNVEDAGVTPCSHVFAFAVWCAMERRRREADSALFGRFVECGVLHFLTHVQVIFSGARHGTLAMIVANVFETPKRLFQFILDNAGHNLLRGADDAGVVEIIRTSAAVISDACRDAPLSLLLELTFDLPPLAELPLAQSERTYKLRTDLMKTLWFARRFESINCAQLGSYLSGIEANMQRTLSGEATNPSFIAGWLRDLRGACQALNEEGILFNDFVEWICLHHQDLMTVLNEAGDSTVVVNALIRFLCEVVSASKHGRFHVKSDSNSVTGLMLFVVLCEVIEKLEETAFADYRIAALGGSSSDYEKTLKPWMISMDIMRKCVQGFFVPFGAMIYYNDKRYESNAFLLVRKLTMVEPSVFKERPKFTLVALDLLQSMTDGNLYFPLTHLESDGLLKLVDVVINICEDLDTSPDTLSYGLGFLVFIASLVREVKVILATPNLQSSEVSVAPPPASLPHTFSQSLPSPSPASRGAHGSPTLRFTLKVKEELARMLAPHQDLWHRLISVAMGIIVFRDRATNMGSRVVYPIFEAHPPFWYNFVEQFVASYPERKQLGVREALSILTNAVESQEKFFSEVFTFRQAMRRLNS
ncbi:hypothetical protein TraAM80_03095 [Trypanosoma rangeli]|uniref:Uncharacterized protein n=1 Tax=Trypanosoma rangeli TaxID=5698 RepID=A0A422NQS9_TRYRA|nr:uncharacterized protein TraAM80_03095 [Trypanosoma rangeli]RNF07815.1 hypothetical protein TraAM80_03095 [Trypanosoma rangeli]|eukprot:RNF07815.1 hypothetical protein TraAM80_03095 [Trypanosoma rangeli]